MRVVPPVAIVPASCASKLASSRRRTVAARASPTSSASSAAARKMAGRRSRTRWATWWRWWPSSTWGGWCGIGWGDWEGLGVWLGVGEGSGSGSAAVQVLSCAAAAAAGAGAAGTSTLIWYALPQPPLVYVLGLQLQLAGQKLPPLLTAATLRQRPSRRRTEKRECRSSLYARPPTSSATPKLAQRSACTIAGSAAVFRQRRAAPRPHVPLGGGGQFLPGARPASWGGSRFWRLRCPVGYPRAHRPAGS